MTFVKTKKKNTPIELNKKQQQATTKKGETDECFEL